MKIINDDCVRRLRELKSATVDLVITSPPYNCGIPYRSYNDLRPWNEYLEWCASWLKELFRVCKDDGRIAVNVLVELGIENNQIRVSPLHEFLALIRNAGFTVFGLPFWVDPHRGKLTAWGSWKNASCPYIYNPCEVVILAYKKFRKKQQRGKNTISKEDFIRGCSGVWNFTPDTKPLTIATFPVGLPQLLIELLSYEGDLVLDPFAGSGTTGVACVKTGRTFIGIEIDDLYCKIANERIQKTQAEQTQPVISSPDRSP